MKQQFFSGTAASLLSKGLIRNAKGGLINAHPHSDESERSPRIHAGEFKGIRKICGIFNLIGDHGENYVVEVLPKSFGESSGQASIDTWLTFFGMLRVDGLFKAPDGFIETFSQALSEASSANRSALILETFLLETFSQLAYALYKGAPLNNTRERFSSAAIRGRINWAAQIRKHADLKHTHEIESQVFNFESKLYSFVRSAFDELSRRHKSVLVSPRARRLLSELRQATEVFPANSALAEQRLFIRDFLRQTPPKFLHFREAIAGLAKWTYGDASEVKSDVDFSLSGFAVNLEKIFEKWCRRELARGLTEISSPLTIPQAEQEFHWGLHSATEKNEGQHGRELRPDIIFCDNKNDGVTIPVVADAKYKDFVDDLGQLEKNSEYRIDRYDLFQVLTYQTAFVENKFLTWVQSRETKLMQTTKPRILILVPANQPKLGAGFYTVDRKQWTLKIVGMPFNSYLNGKEYKAEIRDLLSEILDS